MNTKPLVSIIIPAYNVEGFIGQCLQSIALQSYKNIEIIVVNDGSTDSTESVIKSSPLFTQINYIGQENQGVSSARNRALENVKGEYVVFIDADDVIDPSYIELLVGSGDGVDIITCSHVEFIEGNIPKFSHSAGTKNLNGGDFIKEVLYGNVISSAPHGKMFKSEVVKNQYFDTEIHIGEDLDFLYKIYEANNSLHVKSLDAKLYGYRIHSGSAMNSEYSQKYRVYFEKVRFVRNKLMNKENSVKKAADYRLFGVASFCLAISKSEDDNKEYMRGINDTKWSILGARSTMKNRILAISYIISSSITNYVRSRAWQK